MKVTTKVMAVLWALVLAGLWLPQVTLAGHCPDSGNCCETDVTSPAWMKSVWTRSGLVVRASFGTPISTVEVSVRSRPGRRTHRRGFVWIGSFRIGAYRSR